MAGTEGSRRSNSFMAAKCAAITVSREKGGNVEIPAARCESVNVNAEGETRGESGGKSRVGGCAEIVGGNGLTVCSGLS